MSKVENLNNKYDVYYNNLENFNNVNSPSNISNETNTIKKEMNKIKDQLFELGGKGAASAEDALTEKIKINQNWDTYTEEALVPATKKIPELKTLLNRRKKINSGMYNIEYMQDYYGSNADFTAYLRSYPQQGIDIYIPYDEIDTKIDNKISEIKKLAKVVTRVIDPGPQVLYGPPSMLTEPLIQPAYGIKDPIDQPLYGVLQPEYGVKDPIIQPAYGIKDPIDQPLYGVIQPKYGVKEPSTVITRQVLYGVLQPEYGVKEPSTIICRQALYGVKEPVIRQYEQALYAAPNIDQKIETFDVDGNFDVTTVDALKKYINK